MKYVVVTCSIFQLLDVFVTDNTKTRDPADMKLERAVEKIEKFDNLGWKALSQGVQIVEGFRSTLVE